MVAEGREGENPAGGIPASFLEAAVSADRRFGWFLWGKGPRPLVGRAPSPGGPGPKPQVGWFLKAKPWGLGPTGDLAHRPLFGVWIPPLSPVDLLADNVFAPAFQPLGRAPSP